MCEAEEVLNWLLEELKNKAGQHCAEVKNFARHLELNVSFMDRYEEERAIDSVWPLETVSNELSDLVREAMQRLKESKRKTRHETRGDEVMSTWITIEVEAGVDVPRDVLGMWVAQQLNHPSEMVERSPEEEAALAVLDDYQGPITVMWRDQQGEEQA